MEFAQQLFAMLDEETRARLVYKPSKSVRGRLLKRVTPLFEESKGREKHRFSDIHFIVGEERADFYGHKFVFASLSPWFETRLYDNGGVNELEIPEISEDAFQCIYNVAYGQDAPLTTDNVLQVLEASRTMSIDFLSGECLGLLAQNITGGNVMDIFNAAMDQNLLTLPFERRCCKVILKFSADVLNSPGFLQASTELMVKLVECDFFNVKEVDLWRQLVLWAKTKAAEELESKNGETPMGDEQDFNVGDSVILVNGNVGTIAFKGEVAFGPGIWFGIDLRDATGDTSGTVDDNEYFTASKEDGGVFVRANKIGAKVAEPRAEEDIKVTCACGGDLTQSTAAQVGGGQAVKCSLCTRSLGKEDTVVHHCERGRVKAHEAGYQICEECFEKRKGEEQKENEILQPVPRDVQYLRQVMPFVRFPIMPVDYFVNKISPLMPRQMADSVLMSKIAPTRPCMFPTQNRMDWNASGGDGLEYTVIAAKCAFEKAQNIPTEGAQAQWSGLTMNTQGMAQWFIMDCGAVAHLTALDMKNHYDDGDTIKDVTIFALDPEREYSDEEHESEYWLEQCSFVGAKVKTWQKDIALHTTVNSRYWKFLCTSVYGGEGNYTCLNELKLKGTKEDEEDDDDNLEPRIINAPYTVPAASHAIARAQAMAMGQAGPEWSHIKMSDAGKAQWFIFDLGSPGHIQKLEMQHRYNDNDTIKDIELYYLPPDVGLTQEEKKDEGGSWIKACDLVSRQTTDNQEIETPDIDANVKARFWKFVVMTVYGGGLDCNHYPCMNAFNVYISQPMWTTGFCEE